jgi:hypothetical protein
MDKKQTDSATAVDGYCNYSAHCCAGVYDAQRKTGERYCRAWRTGREA